MLSELAKLQTILDAMSDEQREAVLKAARTLVLPAKAEPPIPIVPVVRQTGYWHITDGVFECYIDERDATTREEAQERSCDFLQPWYYRGAPSLEEDTIELVEYEQFAKWLRRRYGR